MPCKTRILWTPQRRAGVVACVVIALLGVTGCGQKGPLYLPTEPASTNRATLLQTLKPPLLDFQGNQVERVDALDPADPASRANRAPSVQPITPAAAASRGAAR
ncbi:MAG: lipoprotein [Variovorax sp.]